MDNFHIEATGYGITEDDALQNAKRLVLASVVYDQDLQHTDKFVQPGERFDRLAFTSKNTIDPQTGFVNDLAIEELLQITDIFGPIDILSTSVSMEGGQVSTQVTVKIEIQTDALRAKLIENSVLTCLDPSATAPCKDVTSTLIPYPTLKFSKPIKEVENWKGHPLYSQPWKNPPEKEDANTIYIPAGVHCVALDERYGAKTADDAALAANVAVLDPTNFKAWWYKVKILEGDMKGQVGWAQVQSSYNDDVVLQLLDPEQSQDWMMKQSAVVEDDDPEPPVLLDKGGKRIPPPQKMRPSLSLNPDEYPKYTTHVVRVPQNFDGLRDINPQGKALIYTKPGHGRQIGFLDNNTPVEIIEPNVGKTCEWHKIRLNNTSPINALNLQTQGKLQSLDQAVYIYAPYTLILKNSVFKNGDGVDVPYYNLPYVVPTPEDTLERQTGQVTGVKKAWHTVATCAPWITEEASETNRNYWKSAYNVVVKVNRPGEEKTVYSVWAERIADVEDPTDENDVHQKKDPETVEAEGADPEISPEDVEATVSALGDTPEEQQTTYDAGRALGLLTLLKFYDKEYDLLTVMRLAKLPYFVKVEGVYVDETIPRGPVKFYVSVPMRFFDAMPQKQVPFQLDRDSRLDEYIEEQKFEREVAESLENLNELEKKLGTEGIGASIYQTFHGKDLNEEIQKVVNRIEINRMRALAVDNPRFEGQKVFFSSTFYVKKMKKELGSLKKVFKYYDKKIKTAKEKRSYIFPGFSAPLDLKRESEILDEFLGQLQEFLNLNNYAYKTKMPANRNDEGTPSSPTNKSIIEIGWNEKFEILYVLFNGQHLRVGFECAMQTEPFSLQRTNAFVHRMPAINKTYSSRKRKKAPPEEWVKKNVYPAAVIIPSAITPEEKKENDLETKIKKMNATSVKITKDVQGQEAIEADEETHTIIASKEKDKKQDNKDSIFSPKNVGKALKTMKTVSDAYDLVLDTMGNLQPMIDEIAICLTGEAFDIEEQIYNMILEPLIKDITGRDVDIKSIELTEDAKDAKEFLMAVFTSVEYDCLIDLLASTIQFANEVEPTVTPEEEEVEIINGQAPPDYTDISGDEIVADFMVDGTAGGSPPYLPLSESPEAGEPVYEIILPEDPGPGALAYVTVIMYKNANVNSEQLAQGVQGNKAKVLSISPDGYFSEVQITSDGMHKDLKGYVDARTIVATQPNLIGALRDGSQVNKLKNPSDDTKYFEDGQWTKVEVKVAYASNPSNPEELWPDEALGKNLNGKQGWVPTAFLKPISEEALASADASKILLQKGSADKKNGLFNEVFIWQMYLIHSVEEGGVRDLLLPDIPLGKTSSANKKLPAKYSKKFSWAFFGKSEKSGKLFGDRTERLTEIYFANKDKGKNEGQPNPKNKKDFVTNEDFAPAAEFFKNFNTKKFEKELSEIEEELSLPQPMTVLGAVTYPPPGFYTGKRSKCDWKYVAVVRAATEYEIARKKKNKGKIARLKKKLSKKQLAYQTCMGKDRSKVYGEKRTFLSGGDPTTEQIIRTDAYLLNSANVSEECDKLYKELVVTLGGDPNAPPGIQQGLTWPGEANATKEQKDAFEKWRECISKTVKEKEKALKKAAEKDALSQQEGKPATITATSELLAKENNEANPPEEEEKEYAYYPVPQTFDQLVRQLTQWDDWPDNIQFVHDDPADTVAAMLKAFKRTPCVAVKEKLLDIMLDETEERYPLRAKVIRTTIEAALTLAEKSLTVPNFKPFTTPESPRLKTDNTGAEFSRLVKKNFEKIARNVILNAVQECLRTIKENCIEPADDGTRVSPLDLFDADTINKLNNLGKKYGNLLDPGLSGNIASPSGDFDFVLFLKTIMSGLSVSQKCSILIGDLYRDEVLDYIQARIATFYPAYFDFFSKKENMTMLFNAMTDIIDPDICEDNRAQTKSPNNFPDNASVLYGECPPDMNRNNRLGRLIDAGLTAEQAEKQIAREIGDNFKLIADLQNLQDNLENVIKNNTPSPCNQLNDAMRNNKGVDRMLDETLDAIFAPIEMMFTQESRQFIPQLTNPGAYEVPIGTDLLGADGKLDAAAIAKLAQAGQNAGNTSSHTTKQAGAFAEAMRTVKAYKIRTGNGTSQKPEYFKNPDGSGKDWQFEELSSATYYTVDITADIVGSSPASQAMIGKPPAVKNDLAKYLGKTVQEVQVPANQDFKDITEKATPPVAPVLRETLQSPETIKRSDDSFTFDIPGFKDAEMSYKTMRTKSNSNSFYLKLRTFSKDQRGILRLARPISFANNGKVPTKAVKYMQALQYLKSLDQPPGANSPQKGFFAYYVAARFKSDFGGILEETDSGAQPQIDLINTACPKLFDVMTERALEHSLHVISKSKYFNIEELKKVNFTPTTSDLMEDCEASMMMGFIDGSLINLTEIRQNAKELVYDLNDVCNLESHSNGLPGALGPVQEAACDASLHMFMRVSIAENILNGFFAFTQYSPQSVMKNKLMESFLFKKLKDDLLSLNLYSKFKDRAANIVDRRRQAGEAIDAVSKAECLRFLFKESIKPVNDKFDLLLKSKTAPAEMKFLRSLKILDSASRFLNVLQVNTNPRFYKNGNFVLNPAGDYYVERYVKVVDHYDEEGNALLDNFIVDNNILPYLTGPDAAPDTFYNDDGTRKDHLKGFVSIADWSSFIARLASLAGDLWNQGVHENEVVLKIQEMHNSNVYEFFSEISIGIRANYAIGPDDQSQGATEYRQVIDQAMDKIATTKNGIPSGGVISYRNYEQVDDGGRFIYTVPLASSEKPFQKIRSTGLGPETTLLKTVVGLQNIFAREQQDLFKKLTKKDEFSALMKYVFPINRFASLSTLYSMIATKATLPSKDMFTTTKYLIKRSYDLHSAGDDKAYEDPWLKLSGGNAANQGFDEFNPFREMILKLIVETPILILKGLAEIADPNIQITKKIYEGINMAARLGNELILEELEAQYKDQTKDMNAMDKPSFEEWAAENNVKIPDTTFSAPPQIAPLISLMMLPSAMPYGVGFPPPYMFGPGIGPPMTPLAIPYLAGGLISDEFLQSQFAALRPPKRRKVDCPSPFPNPMVLLPPPEKDDDEGPDSETINDD